jgi:hypothetical protein
VRAAAVVEVAEERAVGRQCATATGRQLTVTALLLTPHRATQIELSAEPLVERVRSETQNARAREWGEHLLVAPPLEVPATVVPPCSSTCRLCRVWHIFCLTLC